jgi:hypothetical protein
MKALILLLAFASLSACSTMTELPNGCFVDSRHHQWAYASSQKTAGTTALSMLIGFEWVSGGSHVIHAFEHKGQTWVYDPAHGSIKISNGLVFDPRRILYLTYPARQTQKIILL